MCLVPEKVDKAPSGKSPVTKEVDEWEDVPNLKKTPKIPVNKRLKLKSKLRAISTPNKNESHLHGNVTFMNKSEMDLSAIPVLSPPTTRKSKKKPVAVNEASFQ